MIERSMKIGPRIRLLVPGVDGFHAVSGFAFPVCPQTAMKSEDLHMISPRSSLGCNLFAGGASAAMDGGKRGRHRFVVVMSSFL